jgi:hypothetical protein
MNELVADQLPLRRRGTLEIFDVALKLFKRYFPPLIVWSLVSGLVGLLGMVIPMAGWLISLAVAPLLFGAVGCCVAAAVHGRDVSVKDSWNFISRRYGAVLSVYILSGLLSFVIAIGFIVIFSLLIVGGAAFFASRSGSVFAIAGIIILGLVGSFLFYCVFAWMTTVPLALCLEGDGQNNTRFLSRTYELMRGHWWRIFGLVSLVGLAMLGLTIILGGVANAIFGLGTLKDITSGHFSPVSITKVLAGYVESSSIVSILWVPFYYLSLGVQYLDLRVRKEALDLEWAAQEKQNELV